MGLRGVIGGLAALAASALLTAGAQVGTALADASGDEAALADEAFRAAQGVMQSSVGSAMDRALAYKRDGSPELTALVRERDAALVERQHAARTLAAAEPEERPELAERLAETERRLQAMEQALVRDHPAYMAETRPRTLGIAEVQARLGAHDLLLLLLPDEDGAYIWAVTSEDVRWRHVPALARDRLAQRNAALHQAWRLETEHDPQSDGARLSHDLYADIFEPVESLAVGKRRLLVAGVDEFITVPYAALRADDPALNGDPVWLLDQMAVEHLPSLAALDPALRRDVASDGVLVAGFGAPVLHGAPEAAAVEPAELLRSGHAIHDPERLRALPFLPGAQDELDALNRRFGERALVLSGAAATEPAVHAALQAHSPRYLLFATHGLLPSRLSGGSEPGLVFTPPAGEPQDAGDDGYLSMSEIARLPLSADLVVITACDAWAGASADGRALTGLARSFFLAGASSLVVTLWPIEDQAAARLSDALFARIGDLPPSEALRQAMLSVRDDPSGRFAHPRDWAPYMLTGARVAEAP